MNREHEAGKGDASRVKDLKKYGEGHDLIRWPSQEKKRKEALKKGKKCN